MSVHVAGCHTVPYRTAFYEFLRFNAVFSSLRVDRLQHTKSSKY
jgi:hypothetical protein